MFINYNPTTGLSINTFRNPSGYFGDVSDVEEAIRQDKNASCPLESAKDVLEDGAYWQGSDAIQENLEQIHALICEFEAQK